MAVVHSSCRCHLRSSSYPHMYLPICVSACHALRFNTTLFPRDQRQRRQVFGPPLLPRQEPFHGLLWFKVEGNIVRLFSKRDDVVASGDLLLRPC